MIPSRQAHGICGRALGVCSSWAGCGAARRWSGTTRPRSVSWHGGRPKLTEAFQRVPRHAGHRRDRLQARRSGSQGAGRAGQRLSGDRFLPGRAFAVAAGLQRPARRVAARGRTTGSTATLRLPAGRPDRDADRAAMLRVAAGAAATGVAASHAAAARSLRAARHQRLLGAPAGDRPARRGRAPTSTQVVVTCAGDVVARHAAVLGQAPDHHRPRPRRPPRRRCARRAGASPPPADDDEVETATWPTTTGARPRRRCA